MNDGIVWAWDSFRVEWNEEFPNLDTERLYFHRPSHLNNRIIAQESMFLVYPLTSEHMSIEPLSLLSTRDDGRIEKFIVPASRKPLIRQQLDDFGINVLSMFPSMNSAAAMVGEQFLME